jgi:hypothetical protein
MDAAPQPLGGSCSRTPRGVPELHDVPMLGYTYRSRRASVIGMTTTYIAKLHQVCRSAARAAVQRAVVGSALLGLGGCAIVPETTHYGSQSYGLQAGPGELDIQSETPHNSREECENICLESADKIDSVAWWLTDTVAAASGGIAPWDPRARERAFKVYEPLPSAELRGDVFFDLHYGECVRDVNKPTGHRDFNSVAAYPSKNVLGTSLCYWYEESETKLLTDLGLGQDPQNPQPPQDEQAQVTVETLPPEAVAAVVEQPRPMLPAGDLLSKHVVSEIEALRDKAAPPESAVPSRLADTREVYIVSPQAVDEMLPSVARALVPLASNVMQQGVASAASALETMHDAQLHEVPPEQPVKQVTIIAMAPPQPRTSTPPASASAQNAQATSAEEMLKVSPTYENVGATVAAVRTTADQAQRLVSSAVQDGVRYAHARVVSTQVGQAALVADVFVQVPRLVSNVAASAVSATASAATALPSVQVAAPASTTTPAPVASQTPVTSAVIGANVKTTYLVTEYPGTSLLDMPASSAGVIAFMPLGSFAVAMGACSQSDVYCPVQFENYPAPSYALRSALQLVEPSRVPKPVYSGPGRVRQDTGYNLRLREEPNTSSRVVIGMPPLAAVQVIRVVTEADGFGPVYGWLKVSYTDASSGKTYEGYCAGAWVDFVK